MSEYYLSSPQTAGYAAHVPEGRKPGKRCSKSYDIKYFQNHTSIYQCFTQLITHQHESYDMMESISTWHTPHGKHTNPKALKKPPPNRSKARRSHVSNLRLPVSDEVCSMTPCFIVSVLRKLAGTRQLPSVVPVDLLMPVPVSRILCYRVYPAFGNPPFPPPSLLYHKSHNYTILELDFHTTQNSQPRLAFTQEPSSQWLTEHNQRKLPPNLPSVLYSVYENPRVSRQNDA